MQATKNSAHGGQADAREDAATRRDATTVMREALRGYQTCAACGGQDSRPIAFTLVHPLEGERCGFLCRPCMHGLNDRANDPILVADDTGVAFAGGMVRRIWTRTTIRSKSVKPLRPVVMMDHAGSGDL